MQVSTVSVRVSSSELVAEVKVKGWLSTKEYTAIKNKQNIWQIDGKEPSAEILLAIRDAQNEHWESEPRTAISTLEIRQGL